MIDPHAILPYNDTTPRTFVDQGDATLEAATKHCKRDGYALVMMHHTKNRKLREPDQLAVMVIDRLANEFDIRAAVNHAAVGEESIIRSQKMANIATKLTLTS